MRPLVVVAGTWEGPLGPSDRHEYLRCPSYHRMLDHIHKEHAPWVSGTQCIYSPGVNVCRDASLRELPDYHRRVDLLFMRPSGTPEGCGRAWTLEQARTILRVACLYERRDVVLDTSPAHSASDIRSLAGAFIKALSEPEFVDCVDIVEFAGVRAALQPVFATESHRWPGQLAKQMANKRRRERRRALQRALPHQA